MLLASWSHRHRTSWSGLVWASCWIYSASIRFRTGKKKNTDGGASNELTAGPPHRCCCRCSLHPIVSHKRRRGPAGDIPRCPSDSPGVLLPLESQCVWMVCAGRSSRCCLWSPLSIVRVCVCVQSRRLSSYVDYSLHSTALLWINLRMAADSVQWTGRPAFNISRSLLWGRSERIGWTTLSGRDYSSGQNSNKLVLCPPNWCCWAQSMKAVLVIKLCNSEKICETINVLKSHEALEQHRAIINVFFPKWQGGGIVHRITYYTPAVHEIQYSHLKWKHWEIKQQLPSFTEFTSQLR